MPHMILNFVPIAMLEKLDLEVQVLACIIQVGFGT
eukprot:CAMPEP_0172662080 /NCGR_PEP_ID=MMETSP1074-20121228/5140_1 /TAXON_ID=2916 /ORGANISM="Ceratium fusus, Strain PA161109" /LENGTH=34 /DNA_ID= /DNA_START= /DNA_END= /DNA_ORIENTATION=